MTKRTVVLVSPYFPPSTLAGVHRTRHLAKHLPATGWNPIVLCVNEAHHEQILDPGLAELVPTNVEVVKVNALPAKLTRAVGIGEISLRSWWTMKSGLMDVLANRSVDAVFISGSPYYPMLLAPEVKRQFSIPVVLDFQDPWVSTWGAAQPAFSKAGLAHKLAMQFEPRALRWADFVTSVSDTQNAEMLARYPWFEQERIAAIPIGGDPDDFTFALEGQKIGNRHLLDRKYTNLSYVGTFWPRVEASVRCLLRAFAQLRASEPELTARIRLNFFGTNADPSDINTFHVRPIAEDEGVADVVNEMPARLPYHEALQVLAQSDGLLLIGSDEPHYTASKIYPALMSGRPFLSLFHCASSAHSILAKSEGGKAISFRNADELYAIEPSIAEGLRTLALNPEVLGKADPNSYALYDARNIAYRFSQIFDRLANNGMA